MVACWDLVRLSGMSRRNEVKNEMDRDMENFIMKSALYSNDALRVYTIFSEFDEYFNWNLRSYCAIKAYWKWRWWEEKRENRQCHGGKPTTSVIRQGEMMFSLLLSCAILSTSQRHSNANQIAVNKYIKLVMIDVIRDENLARNAGPP